MGLISVVSVALGAVLLQAGNQTPKKPHVMHVSQEEMEKRCLTMVAPTWSGPFKTSHFKGHNYLKVIITKTGDVKPIDQDEKNNWGPQFVALSMETVKLWKYKPYMVNGQPVDVETTVSVEYSEDIPDGQVTHPNKE
jgi:protein TonB